MLDLDPVGLDSLDGQASVVEPALDGHRPGGHGPERRLLAGQLENDRLGRDRAGGHDAADRQAVGTDPVDREGAAGVDGSGLDDTCGGRPARLQRLGFERPVDLDRARQGNPLAGEVAADLEETGRLDGPGRERLDVEVVAVLRGKGTEDKNAFEAGDRKTVAERLAGGNPATLRFGPEESYPVTPELTWGRDSEGRPTVTDVEVLEVHLDEE